MELKKIRKEKLERVEIIFSCICSTVISIVIGNIVGIYYLKKNDKDWQKVFEKVTQTTLKEIEKLKK